MGERNFYVNDKMAGMGVEELKRAIKAIDDELNPDPGEARPEPGELRHRELHQQRVVLVEQLTELIGRRAMLEVLHAYALARQRRNDEKAEENRLRRKHGGKSKSKRDRCNIMKHGGISHQAHNENKKGFVLLHQSKRKFM